MKIDNKAILLTRQQMDALRKIQQEEHSRSGEKTRPRPSHRDVSGGHLTEYSGWA
ncbi:hypothetical protein [Xenorhabdus santafensis]|uniref:hypothetical protein n=1 Tax=Xenorhabdus santafensis TaxID=2582833 RepID=UPI0029E7FB81|nr:hypothetical protein [Xenorhabdus sp. 12]